MLKSRIRLISIAIIFFALLLFAKLYMLQIVKSDIYRQKADRQYQKPSTDFNRGTIFFSQKDGVQISAASLKTGFILAMKPNLVKAGGAEDIYNKIAALIPDLDHDDFIAKSNKTNDPYEELKKRIDQETGEKLNKLKLPGITLYQDKWRYYPGGTLASNVLGFMGYKGNEFAGRYGLEREYNDVLSRTQSNTYANFFVETFSNIKKTVIDGETPEGDIVTTIEPKTQAYIEEMITKINSQYSSERTGAIIMNPQTGDIYAMGLNPSFDPNDLKNVKDVALFRNDLIESVYEMGSIMKPLTMSAGIDSGVVNSQTTYLDNGSATFNKKTISNFDKKGRGLITLQCALARSLNTGFAYVEQRVGNTTFGNYFTKYGLGNKTGIDLPNEASGLISNIQPPRNIDIEYVTASFGQGISVTPIEVIHAFSAIANGGVMVKPRLVKEINYKIGTSKKIPVQFDERVIKEDSALEVVNMMVNNFDTTLKSGAHKNPNYSIGVKTGTAQMVRGGSGYADNIHLHSFIGFLPAYNPQFLVFIYTINPRGVSYSSDTLAMPFIELTKFLISYYQVAPDRALGGTGIDGVAGAGTSTSVVVPVGTGRVAPLSKTPPNGKNCTP
jgi:cell division protein FtsI/penicillin-binding protein 2